MFVQQKNNNNNPARVPSISFIDFEQKGLVIKD